MLDFYFFHGLANWCPVFSVLANLNEIPNSSRGGLCPFVFIENFVQEELEFPRVVLLGLHFY